MRRNFILPEEDVDYLNSLGLDWETICSGGNWVLIHRFSVPTGYTVKEVIVALKIEAGYPSSQIDMAYFTPALARTDGKLIGALSPHHMDNKLWQRWSRHRDAANPWRSEVDGLATHLAFVEYWLNREFKIR